MFTLIKLKIQIFGRFLSNMIMPNISVFIAWGIMTTCFIPFGWFPNKDLERLLSPMIIYVLPLLIGYTGAKLFCGDKGGLVGSIATLGVITSTNMPMILGAMIAGPLSGLSVKYFNKFIENKITNGFEMLINNFSLAIIGVIWALISFFTIGPLVEWFSHSLSDVIKLILKYNLLPFTSIVIEPAKIFFLNNIINHGIFSPLGIQEIIEKDRSIFFLMESNPGPGLGVLIAWFFFGKGTLSKTAGGAAIIEFLGGVHEVYFPYVLINPKLIISLILGGMTSTFVLTILHGGLISVVSPGSIISILAMTPKGLYFTNITAIFLSFLVSLISSIFFLRMNIIEENHIQNTLKKNKNNLYKIESVDKNIDLNIKFNKKIETIIFACDAGMGSSAMGASIFRKKIKDANLMNISISNTAINLLPNTVDLVITHKNLTKRAKMHAVNSQHISLNNFLDYHFYDRLVKKIVHNNMNYINYKDPTNNNSNINNIEISKNLFSFSLENIFLNQYANDKETAIKFIGRHLVKQGYVKNEYVNSMLEREKISSTWLGESIALPHGTIEAKDSILKTGVIFCQFPKGVQFGDDVNDIANIVIGVAAKNNEHIMVVSNITNALDDKKIIKKLSTTVKKEEVLSLLNVKKK